MCRTPEFKERLNGPSGANWYAVVPVLFFDFLVMAMPGGILPILINQHYGARSYVLTGYAQSLKGMLAFLAAPALGALSDAVGRKYLFTACVLGTAAPYAALGLGCSLDTHLLLLGLSGTLAATFPLAFAYICDVVPPGPSRISAIGTTIGLSLGTAFLVGPPLGSLLEARYGPSAVFHACLWVTAANVVVAVFGIVEVPPQQPRPRLSALARRANPFLSFKMVRSNVAMRLLVLITAWYYFALWGLVANKGLYARRRFGLSSGETAAQLSTFGLASTLSQVRTAPRPSRPRLRHTRSPPPCPSTVPLHAPPDPTPSSVALAGGRAARGAPLPERRADRAALLRLRGDVAAHLWRRHRQLAALPGDGAPRHLRGRLRLALLHLLAGPTPPS